MAEDVADERSLSERVQDLLADHFGPRGAMANTFYLMVDGMDADGDEFWAEAFTPGASIRRRLGLVEWSRAVVRADAQSHVDAVAFMSDVDPEEDE